MRFPRPTTAFSPLKGESAEAADEKNPPARASDTRHGLRRIIVAWAFGSVFFNVITGAPLAAYVRELGGNDFAWGVLSAAPMLAALSQLYGSAMIERTRERKRLFLFFGTLQRLLWIPIALLPWLFPKGSPLLIPLLVMLAVSGSLSGNFVGPAWMSWMADFVPMQVRGAFFAARMRVGTVMALLAAVGSGWWLDARPGLSSYTILFLVVAVCGATDTLLFRRVPEPEMTSESDGLRLSERIRAPFGDRTFRRFLFYVASFGFAQSFMAAPLWLFVMEELQMSKLGANLTLMGSHMAAMALASSLWGRWTDRFGNRPVLRVCTAVVTLTPLPWLLARPETAGWMWVVTFLTGTFWCGIELGNFNLMLSLFPKERRSASLAMFSVTVGLCAGIAPMLSGALIDLLKGLPPVAFGGWTPGPYRIVFLLSLLGRLMSTLIFLPRVVEPRAASTRALIRSVASDVGERIPRRREE